MAAKDEGNKYFKGGRYELAIKCYTEAIEFCPEGKTDELAIYHQNRAAAYEQLVRNFKPLADPSDWVNMEEDTGAVAMC